MSFNFQPARRYSRHTNRESGHPPLLCALMAAASSGLLGVGIHVPRQVRLPALGVLQHLVRHLELLELLHRGRPPRLVLPGLLVGVPLHGRRPEGDLDVLLLDVRHRPVIQAQQLEVALEVRPAAAAVASLPGLLIVGAVRRAAILGLPARLARSLPLLLLPGGLLPHARRLLLQHPRALPLEERFRQCLALLRIPVPLAHLLPPPPLHVADSLQLVRLRDAGGAHIVRCQRLVLHLLQPLVVPLPAQLARQFGPHIGHRNGNRAEVDVVKYKHRHIRAKERIHHCLDAQARGAAGARHDRLRPRGGEVRLGRHRAFPLRAAPAGDEGLKLLGLVGAALAVDPLAKGVARDVDGQVHQAGGPSSHARRHLQVRDARSVGVRRAQCRVARRLLSLHHVAVRQLPCDGLPHRSWQQWQAAAAGAAVPWGGLHRDSLLHLPRRQRPQRARRHCPARRVRQVTPVLVRRKNLHLRAQAGAALHLRRAPAAHLRLHAFAGPTPQLAPVLHLQRGIEAPEGQQLRPRRVMLAVQQPPRRQEARRALRCLEALHRRGRRQVEGAQQRRRLPGAEPAALRRRATPPATAAALLPCRAIRRGARRAAQPSSGGGRRPACGDPQREQPTGRK
mmetsp:Transcript_20347/g.52088  ORF Transcript_20347/g.52088 Transcript_20347/m.52088 type:complete len:622 (-) Transcript_20347:56-1921(-)